MNHMSLLEPTCNIKKLDERKINQYFDSLPKDVIANIVRRQLPTPSRKRQVLKPKSNSTSVTYIPQNLKNAIINLNLLDEPCNEKRIKLFIGYCKFKNYTYNTTKRYYMILKQNGLFGRDKNILKPERMAFVDNGTPHTRIVSMNDFRIFVKYLHENMSVYTAPILVAVYTGLRTAEILQFSTYTLYQLKMRQPSIAIKRKQTVINYSEENPNIIEPIYWSPIYNSHLSLFIENLIALFNDAYTTFINDKLNSKLFYVTPKTLGNRIRTQYFDAIGKMAPNGFGIHSCRNMIAMLMAENTNNIFAIQEFLQHKHLKTTQRYIKADFSYLTKEFNRITDYELSNIRSNINPNDQIV